MHAAKMGREAMVDMLLSEGANIHAENDVRLLDYTYYSHIAYS
jgi:ankyrin repeat protein